MTTAHSTRHLPSWWRLFAVAVVAAVLGSGLGAPATARAAVGVPTTYLDQTFDSTIGKPTADKPQSKLWYLDGAWWALMVPQGGTLVHIHELMPDHTWRDTGAVVDSRPNSTGDALWSSQDSKLWVASRATGSNLAVNRFSYTSATRSWAVDSGFPVSVSTGGGSESATIDQASDGKYWITYTRGSRVWVSHSTDRTGSAWITPYQPAVPDTVISSDDLSALIAFGDSVGVMWSDQQSGGFRFAIHNNADPDTLWRVEDASAGLLTSDDHINLKQLVGDPQGRIFAVVKTSANDSTTAAPTDVLMAVVTRTPPAGGGNGAGTWTRATAGTVADDHTRPLIMLDSTNNEIYFIATGGEAGGDIFYKKSSLTSMAFGPGRGDRLVDAPFTLNDPTGAKEPVTAQSGLVVIASSSSARRYAHAEMQLAGSTTPPSGDTTAPTVTTRSPIGNATGVAVSANTAATFSEPVQGVDQATFTLRNTATGASVTAVVSQNGTTNQWILNPSANLAAGTQYTATLTGGASAIRDAANNPFATVSWNFTTAAAAADTTAPTVTSRAPAVDATNVGPSPNVTATFSEAVQGVDGATFTLVNGTTGAVVPAVVSRNGTTNQWILNPTDNFTQDTRYTATLTGGATAIRDAANNPLTTVSWSFLTGAAPTVSARTPAVNATAVGRTANVTATFSEAVQGVSTTTFTLRPAAGGANVTAGVTRNGTTNQWILDPGVTLAANTQYTVTITGGTTGVRDLAGNPVATATWTFTTGA